MTDDNSNSEIVDIDTSLEAFEADFLAKPSDELPEPEVEDTEDDALATDEDIDAAEADDVSEPDEEAEAEDEGEDEPESEDEDDEPEPEPKPKGKNRKSFQERINELTRERREAERREAELIRRLEALETRETEVSKQEHPIKEQLPQGAPQPDAVDADGNPLYPLGEFDTAFIRDLTVFTIEHETKTLKAREAEAAAAKAQAEAKDALKAEWSAKLDEAEAEIPEIREHIVELVDAFQGLDPAYGEYIATTIMTSDNGPAIMEYLSQNIGEAQKIVASGAAAATLAIGRLDAILTKTVRPEAEEKRNKKVSAAAEPPTRATRGTKGQQTIRPDTDNLAAFEREFLKKG